MKYIFIFFLSLVLSVSCSCNSHRHEKYKSRPGTSSIERNVESSNSRVARRHQQTPVKAVQQPILASSTTEKEQNGIMTGKEIFQKYNTAVFKILTSDGIGVGQGSGFFIQSNGLAVSNYHVFAGTLVGYESILTVDGKSHKVKEVVYKSKEKDIIIFKVDSRNGSFNFIPMSSRKVEVGDKAYAIGSPLGLDNTLSSGEISQLRPGNLIQINVPIDHGSSGGVLFNEYGEAIGITSSGYDTSTANLNFAISIDVVKQALGR